MSGDCVTYALIFKIFIVLSAIFIILLLMQHFYLLALKLYLFQHMHELDGKYSERVQIPSKAFLSPTLGNTCHTYYFAAR